MRAGSLPYSTRMLTLATVASFLLLLWIAPTHAYDLPPSMNLGGTSFLDGGAPGPGFYFTQYIQYIRSTNFTDSTGSFLLPPFADEELNAWAVLFQGIYLSDQKVLLGGKWGVDVIVPLAVLDLSYGVPNMFGFPEDNGAGIGDVLVGPFLQWDPIMGKKGPIFVHRVEMQATFPTGKYDRMKALNPGANIYSLNPYWAATVFLGPRFAASWRFHYLWTTKNDDPNIPGAASSQAGQAIHLNFSASFEVLHERLRVGINGYYLKQVTDSKVNGNRVPDSKEQVLAVGPGVVYSLSQNDYLFFNTYAETAVENRARANKFNLRWVHRF